ncbi:MULTISPECIES: sigma-70 family RNA polymerase sigma factor [unclassified Streptomyces]|uniref:Sigma-70 family RNA polymerase sigma factor n=1 Tax=Streptomyces castrisilvae TaxID=3033811 RepID=A0ABY9HIH0_9ACTN|nr:MULTISPECIES: sigma-70 family RNA polymerase sigma factor [unclassified Streptomyces]MYY05990.1 sigma-70 family RNA polymerase sigma factor [Streptomyces sp. SID4913]WLQ34325.1 sigma-70 family RNA polymerase sigma factor [Streptomyces sp. Mut1]
MDPDEDLLARSAREPTAFEPLVARHSQALHGYLVRRAPAAADDLLSEVWLQAYAHRKTFDAERGSARGWLFGVAGNVLSRHRQAVARAAAREQRQHPDATTADPWQAVDQRLDAASVGPELREKLAELPENERELLLLVAWEQLTPAEAAAAVGVPAGTARSRLHRARTRLRDGLSRTTRTTLTGDFA